MTNPLAHTSNPRLVYPRGVLAPERLPGGIAAPAAWLYGALSSWARGVGLGRRPQPPAGTCVISIGNIEVGGNGKTPFAIHLINELVRRGHRPVYLSRGYGSSSESMGLTTIVGDADERPHAEKVRWLSQDTELLAHEIGDEGAVVAARTGNVPLLFDRDRRRGIAAAVEVFKATHIVIDDAFQSWRVPRHVDIVLIDRQRPFGNGRLLPAGTLREKPTALVRADFIGVNGLDADEDPNGHESTIAAAAGSGKRVFGIRRRLSFCDSSGNTVDAPSRAASLSAIARPDGFDHALVSGGVDVPLSIRYPDHYRYGRDDIALIRQAMAEDSVTTLLTTEKDWVKLATRWGAAPEVVIARLELDVVGDDAVWQEIEKPRTSSAASTRR